jgi:hypothetical protein
MEELEKQNLSDLIEELVEAKEVYLSRKKEEESAREKYLEGGGYSWGYYGSEYFDRTAEAKSKVDEIKGKIANLTI